MEKKATEDVVSPESKKKTRKVPRKVPDREKDQESDTCSPKIEPAVAESDQNYRVTGSRSNTEYEKKDEKNRGPRHRSKSFINEPSRTKPQDQKKPSCDSNKLNRIVHGSHGDGVQALETPESRRNQDSDPTEQAKSQEKPCSEVLSDNPPNEQSVGNNELDPTLSIPSLAQVYRSYNPSIPLDQHQVAQSLVGNSQAGSFVSSYLNGYRSYLDHLRKTCGRDVDTALKLQGKESSNVVPLVLPLTRMTPVFSEDSRDDPEFRELLKKTTTESIRKLWPHPAKTNIVRRAGLKTTPQKGASLVSVYLDTPEEHEICDPLTKTECDILQAGCGLDNYFVDCEISNAGQFCVSEDESTENAETLGSTENTESGTCDESNLGIRAPVKNVIMSSSVVNAIPVGDTGSRTSNATKLISSMTKGVTKKTMIAGDNTFNNAVATPANTEMPSEWGMGVSETKEQKFPAFQPLQQKRPTVIENLMQQKLIQQQQLKRQIILHQERQKQAVTQQKRQMIQQQTQQRQQYQMTLSSQKRQDFNQGNADASNLWFPSTQLGTQSQNGQLGTFGPELTTADQEQCTGLDDKCAQLSPREGETNTSMFAQMPDYFSSSGSNLSQKTMFGGFSRTREDVPMQARTLKASYACLDPSSSMSLDPLFSDAGGDHNSDMSHLTVGAQIGLPQSYSGVLGDKTSGDSSRAWPDIPRQFEPIKDTSNKNDGSAADDKFKRVNCAISRASPLEQQRDNLVDFPRLATRPIVKTNCTTSGHDATRFTSAMTSRSTMSDMNPYNSPSVIGSKVPDNNWGIGIGEPDVFSGGFSQVPTSSADVLGLRYINDGADMVEQARISRLHQWRQDAGSVNDLNSFTSAGFNSMGFGHHMVSQAQPRSYSPSKMVSWNTQINPSPLDMPLGQQTLHEDERKQMILNSLDSGSQAFNPTSRCRSWSSTNEGSHIDNGQVMTVNDKDIPHSSASLSQLPNLQYQQLEEERSRQKLQDASVQDRQDVLNATDASVYKLSEDLENTMIGDHPSSLPWHELAVIPDDNDFDLGGGQNNFMKFQSFDRPNDDSEYGAFRGDDSKRIIRGELGGPNSDNTSSRGLTSQHYSRGQPHSQRPRMILGGNNSKQFADEKERSDIEESNKRLREMLGIANQEKEYLGQQSATLRYQDSMGMQGQHILSPGLVGSTSSQLQGLVHPTTTQATSRFQQMSNKVPTSMGMTQQMYCVPNILVPPPPVPNATSGRTPGMIPVAGMMTTSASRFSQGMIRVPFMDMSRLVYVQQVPVNVSGTPNNNNHNNSSSSNPHVNTSNIITINTAENDFSMNGLGDKGPRGMKQNSMKNNKSLLLKLRPGSEEMAHSMMGPRPGIDDGVCLRPPKTRSGHWDPDLDHDFSNSLISKTNNLENIGIIAPNTVGTNGEVMYNPEYGYLYQDMSNLQSTGSSTTGEQTKMPNFMHWPVAADAHPEMLDMLPVKRAMAEEGAAAGHQRYCWPDMEFMMPTSREQLQAVRRSNKPMGSNRANLISILPKGATDGGEGGSGKEMPFDKSQL